MTSGAGAKPDRSFRPRFGISYWSKFFSSIRGKLIALFSMIFGASLVVVAVISFQVFSISHQADFDALLYNHAVDVASTLATSLFAPLPFSPFSLETEEKKTMFPLRHSFLQIRNLDGTLVAKSQNMDESILPITRQMQTDLQTKGVSFLTLKSEALPPTAGAPTAKFRVISYIVRKGGLPILILQIAAPMTLIEQSENQLIRLFLILIPLALLISAVTGYTVTEKAFGPIREMIKKTSDIQILNLNERISVVQEDPELKALATTLNELLSRVEKAVRLQERFIADASHQLKTPLAIMKGELEILLRDPSGSPSQRAYLVSIGAELTQLVRLVENLLLLAKMDAGHGVISFQKLRFDELVLDTVSKMSNVAREKKLILKPQLHSSAPDEPGKAFARSPSEKIDFEFRGDPDLLRSLLITLLENAIKYSPEGGVVEVSLTETTDLFLLEVQDHGVGIEAHELDSIFERFHRNSTQALKISGSGLGLAIAKRIAELHNGKITVSSTPNQGATFRVELKKA